MSCDSFMNHIQNITKIIAEFLGNFQKVLMFKIIVLDLAIRLQSKCYVGGITRTSVILRITILFSIYSYNSIARNGPVMNNYYLQ